MITLLVLLALPGRASALHDAEVCLATYDLVCAQEARNKLEASAPRAPETLGLEARVAFYEGDYDAAVRALDQLQAEGGRTDEIEARAPIRPTAAAARGFVVENGDGVAIRYAPGVDAILGTEAAETLARARRTYDGLFGGGPQHPVVLDIFPTARRFIDASGLPAEAVQTTGVVALSKWTRLLVTSPRALARGYGWKDTVAHEYIHLVVAYRTDDRAPVWLQEGLAKHLESRWRGTATGSLGVHSESLLADAIAHDNFVPFEKFRHSMAYLDSGKEAALAFAQVATMVRYLLAQAGDDALPTLLDRVRDGEEAEQVVAELAGSGDFDEFRAGWLAWLAQQPLIAAHIEALPVVLDGEGDAYASDPVLAARPDLAKFARLGDLLREAGRPAAALVEYAKAEDPDGQPSPLLVARRAACYEALGDAARALEIAGEAATMYPEFTLLQVTLGRLLDTAGRTEEAVHAWSAAHDLNPYDPEVQRALVRDYEKLGNLELARRHLRYARILETGGAVTETEG